MTYSVPTKKYPIAADVNASALFVAQRQSDSATTNGGIVASGVEPVPQLGTDATGLGLSYLQAQLDAIMCAVGYQHQTHAAPSGSISTSSTTFVAAAFPSAVFTAQIAKTYLVAVDVSSFGSILSGGQATAFWRLTVNGTPYELSNVVTTFTVANVRARASWRVPVAMAAGLNTLSLQWRCISGETIAANTSDVVTYTVTG